MNIKLLAILCFSLKLLRLCNLLSLDVALGALAMGLLAVEVLNCSLSLSWWIILPLVVWIIYTADHLSDALKSKDVVTSLRHRFHLRYFRLLASIILLVALVTVVCAFFYLPENIFSIGFLLSFLTLIYLVYSRLSQSQPLPKEIIVATLYTVGIWFAPLLVATTIQWWVFFPILFTFFTAFNNLLLFSIFGNREDTTSKFISLSTVLGVKTCHQIFNITLFITFVASITFGFLLWENYKLLIVAVIFVAINMTLWYIIKHKAIFAKKDNYRLLGDAIFILPLVLKLN